MERAKRILIVDDEEQHLALTRELVRELGYETETAHDGIDALGKLALDVDLLLLDLNMPRMDGFQVMRRLRGDERYKNLPVIMVTALDSRRDRLQAVEAGANDFISKPVERTELMVRLTAQLDLREARAALERYGTRLEEQVAKRTAQLRESLEEAAAAQRSAYDAQIEIIRRLVLAAERKDPATGQHIVRLSRYSGIMAAALQYSAHQADVLRHAITMHDVGKIGIPDAILGKPGRLSADERRTMESHTVIGGRILAGSRSELVREGEVIALSHHERWDGSGYPYGLQGDAIPRSGRICAVVDVFDALTTRRPYRQALPLEEALELMLRGRESQFDPELLDLFAANHERAANVFASLAGGAGGGEPHLSAH